jgi:hypothetical protein
MSVGSTVKTTASPCRAMTAKQGSSLARQRRRQRLLYLALCTLLIPVGIGTKLYSGPGAAWISDSVGGVLYVVFWILVLMAARPTTRPVVAALGVLAVTSLLEALQLWHPAWLAPVRATFVGHALLGNTFSWLDYPYYALGAMIGWAAVALVRRSGPTLPTVP